MKYCPHCGSSMQDEAMFCMNCGTVFESAPAAPAAPASPVPPAPAVPPQVTPSPAPAQKSKKGLIAALWTTIVALVLILAIVVSYSFGLLDGVLDSLGIETSIRDKGDDDDKAEPTTPTDPTDPTVPTDPTDPPSSTDPTAPTEPLPPEKQTYTIKVWSPHEDQTSLWLTKKQQQFADAFPEYEIQWVNEVMYESDAGSAIIADSTSAADVYMFANDQLGRLIRAGGLTRLDKPYKSQVKADNNEFMVNTVTYTDEEIYGFPISNNTWFLYYDKDVFTEEDVKSLDTMLEKGRVYLPLTNAWTGGCFFLGTGCTIFGTNGRDLDAGIDFGGEKGYLAARKMLELNANPNTITGDLDISKFITGEVDATFCGSWCRGELEARFGDRLGVAMLPTFSIDGKTYQMTAMSGSKCIGVNPYADTVEGKLDLCMAFAAFLATEESQFERYEARGIIPAHQNLLNYEPIKSDAVAVAEMNTIQYASVVQSYLEEMSYFWTPMGTFGGRILSGIINQDNYEIAVDELDDAFQGAW